MQDFHKELVEKRKTVEKLFRNASTTAAAAAAGETGDKDETAAMSESKQKLATLQQKWNMLWRLSLDTKKKLQDNFAALLQVKAHECISALTRPVASRPGTRPKPT